MRAIEYIYQYQEQLLRAQLLRGKADAITSALDSVTALNGDVERVQTSKDPYRRSALLAELADTTRALRVEAEGAEMLGLEILATVSKIDSPVLSRCLMYCGIMSMTDREIEQQTGEKHLSAYWLDAITELQKVLDARESENAGAAL